MKKKSGSQSAFLNLRVLIGLLASIFAIWLAVFAVANQFNSPLQSSGEAGVSTPKAFAINADQRFNPSPKRSFGPFPTIQLEQVASDLIMPVTVTNAGDGTGRIFIVQQEGQILILINGTILPTPFLDIADVVGCCGEQGLLGLAFHPQYATNGFFYVNYTDNAGDTQVVRYTVSAADPNVADPDSAFPILNQDQPFSNHNGGALIFGPDGYLYIPLGDGGSGGDPEENGQDLTTWLGKILRVDVNSDHFPGDPDLNYAVPPDNPFVNDPDALDEIWAYGVRNPWRCTFDRLTGDFFIADVGQGTREEIDFQPAASAGGENYGWDVLEGTFCHEDVPPGSCADFLSGGSTLPVLEYNNAGPNCAVTGGYRYRGQLYPQLDGIYFYSDLCSGTIWGAIQDQQGRWVSDVLLESGLTVTTFGEDEEGEVYVADYSGGVLYRIVGVGPTPTPTATATATATVTVTPTATVSPSPTATVSPSPTATTTPTATTSPTPTVSPSPTAPPRATPRPRGTPRPRPTP